MVPQWEQRTVPFRESPLLTVSLPVVRIPLSTGFPV